MKRICRIILPLKRHNLRFVAVRSTSSLPNAGALRFSHSTAQENEYGETWEDLAPKARVAPAVAESFSSKQSVVSSPNLTLNQSPTTDAPIEFEIRPGEFEHLTTLSDFSAALRDRKNGGIAPLLHHALGTLSPSDASSLFKQAKSQGAAPPPHLISILFQSLAAESENEHQYAEDSLFWFEEIRTLGKIDESHISAMVECLVHAGKRNSALKVVLEVSHLFEDDTQLLRIIASKAWRGMHPSDLETLWIGQLEELGPDQAPAAVITAGILLAMAEQNDWTRVLRVWKTAEDRGAILEQEVWRQLIRFASVAREHDVASKFITEYGKRGHAIDSEVAIPMFWTNAQLGKASEAISAIIEGGTKRHYGFLVSAVEKLCAQGKRQEAKDLMREAVNRGLDVGMVSLKLLVGLLCQAGDFEGAHEFARMFARSKHRFESDLHDDFLLFLHTAGRRDQAAIVLQEMVECRIPLNPKHSALHSRIFARLGKFKESVRALSSLPSLLDSERVLSSFLTEFSKEKRADLIQGMIMECVLQSAQFLGAVHHNILISALCQEGKVLTALDFAELLIHANTRIDSVTLTTILHALEKEIIMGEPHPDTLPAASRAAHLWKKMQRSGVEFSAIHHTLFVRFLCRSGLVDKAKTHVATQLKDPNAASFITGQCMSSIFFALNNRERYSETLELFKTAAECGVKFNPASARNLLKAASASYRSDIAHNARRLFDSQGVDPSARGN